MTPFIADLVSRGFPPEELDRIAQEGSFEAVQELNLATGFLHPGLRSRFRRDFRERMAAQEAERARKSPC